MIIFFYGYKKELPDVFFDDWVTIKKYVTKKIQQQNHLDYSFVLEQNESLNDMAVPADSSESSDSEDSKILESLCSLENFQSPLLLTTIDKVASDFQTESTSALYVGKDSPDDKNYDLMTEVKGKSNIKGKKSFIKGEDPKNLMDINTEENNVLKSLLMTRGEVTSTSEVSNLSLESLFVDNKVAVNSLDSSIDLDIDKQVNYDKEEISVQAQEIINEKFEEELRQEWVKRVKIPLPEFIETANNQDSILPSNNKLIENISTNNKITKSQVNFTEHNFYNCFENFYIVIKIILGNRNLSIKFFKILMCTHTFFIFILLNLKAFFYSVYLAYKFKNFYQGIYSIHKIIKYNWNKYQLTQNLISLTKNFMNKEIAKKISKSTLKKLRPKKSNVTIEFLNDSSYNYYNTYYYTKQGILRRIYKKFKIPVKYKKVTISFYFFVYLQSLQKIFENIVYSYKTSFNKQNVWLIPNYQMRLSFTSSRTIKFKTETLVNSDVSIVKTLPVLESFIVKSDNWKKTFRAYLRQSIKIALKNINNPTLFKINHIYNVALPYKFLTQFNISTNNALQNLKINSPTAYLFVYQSTNPLLNVSFDTFRLVHKANKSVVEWVGSKNIALFIVFCEYILNQNLTVDLSIECCFEHILIDNIKVAKINAQFTKKVLNAKTIVITWKKNSFPPFYIFKFKKFLTSTILIKNSNLTLVNTSPNINSLVAKQIAKFIYNKNLKSLTYFDWNIKQSLGVLTSNLFFYLKHNYIARMTYFLLLIGYEFYLESTIMSSYNKSKIVDSSKHPMSKIRQVNLVNLNTLSTQLLPTQQSKNLVKPVTGISVPKTNHWQYEWLVVKKVLFLCKQLKRLKKIENFNMKNDSCYYQKRKKIQNLTLLKQNIYFLFTERYDDLFLNDTGVIHSYYFNEIYADEIKNISKLFKYIKRCKTFNDNKQLYALSDLHLNQIKFYSRLFYYKISAKKKTKVKTGVYINERIKNKYNILEKVVYLQKKNQKGNILYTIPVLKNIILRLYTNNYKLLTDINSSSLKRTSNKHELKFVDNSKLNISEAISTTTTKIENKESWVTGEPVVVSRIVKATSDSTKTAVDNQPSDSFMETNNRDTNSINEFYITNLENAVFDWVNKKISEIHINSTRISYQQLKEKKFTLKGKLDNYRLWRFYIKKNWIEKIKILSLGEVNWFLFKTINLNTNQQFQSFLKVKKTYSEWQKLIPLLSQKPEYFRFILKTGFWKFMPRIPLSTHFFYKLLNVNIKKKFYKTDILVNLKMLFFELNSQKYNLNLKNVDNLIGPTKSWTYYDTNRRKKIKKLNNNLVCSYAEKCVCLPSFVCLQSLANLSKIHYKIQKKVLKITNYEIHTLQLVDLTPKLYLENLACIVFRHVVVINLLEMSSQLLFDLINFFFKYRVYYRDIYFYIETSKFAFICQYKKVMTKKQGVWNRKTSNFVLNGVSNFLHFNTNYNNNKIQKEDILVFNCHLHIPGISTIYKTMPWALKSSLLYKGKIKPSSIFTYSHIKSRMVLKKNKKIF